jgi:hypothetical protein
MLDAMPLFNLIGVSSDSLTRVSVYAAVAFGSRGLYYYCWGGGGLWEWTQDDNVGTPSPNYPYAKEANADAAVWGRLLLRTRYIGSVTTWPCFWRHCVRPGATPIATVAAMSSDLTAGLFVPINATNGENNNSNASGYVMVVDLRVANTVGAFSPRPITVTVAADCSPELVAPGVERISYFNASVTV